MSALACLLALTACGPAADSSSPSSGTATAAPSGTSPTGGTGSSPTASAATPPGSAASAGAAAYTVTATSTSATVRATDGSSATGEVTRPRFTVTGPDAAAAGRVQAALNATVEARIEEFAGALVGDAPAAPAGAPGSTDEIRLVRHVAWHRLLSVQLSDFSYVSGGAHPVTTLLAVTVDVTDGRRVTASDLFADVPAVDRAVRTRLQARDVDADTARTLTVGTTSGGDLETLPSYPTASGLWVGVSQCSAVCALGSFEFTVPWSALPRPRTA